MYKNSYTSTVKPNLAISVSELNRQARHLLERSFLTVEVQGELSNFVRPSSGHWYFTLKDSNAQVRCAMFKSRNASLRFQPKNGDQVTVRAKVSIYEGRGDYQLICEQMLDGGQGLLQQSFEALKLKLSEEGLFNAEHKQPLPKYAQHVGIITSATGAAVHDILTVLRRRYPQLPVTIYPTAVQGDEASFQICEAIKLANKHQKCDVLIVGRGGGSLEDLWPFNTEAVARAIHTSQIPVISAVGHEVDFTISDFSADLRAATPSAAAELISPDQRILKNQLEQLQHRLKRQLRHRLQFHQSRLNTIQAKLRHPGERLRERAQRLDSLELRLIQQIKQRLNRNRLHTENIRKRLALVAPQRRIERQRIELVNLEQRLQRNLQHKMEQAQVKLANNAARLNAVSPLATLDRGYAIAQNAQQEVVQNISQVSVGDNLDIRISDGQIQTTVTALTAQD